MCSSAWHISDPFAFCCFVLFLAMTIHSPTLSFYLASFYIVMAGLALGRIKVSPVKDFERIAEIRAQRHEHMRQRNNVTSCRSPTRELDTSQIKKDLKKKRYQEFLRRRSVSPERRCSNHCTRKNCSPKIYYSLEQHSSSSKMLHANIQNTPVDKGHSAMSLLSRSSMTDGPSSHSQVNTTVFHCLYYCNKCMSSHH